MQDFTKQIVTLSSILVLGTGLSLPAAASFDPLGAEELAKEFSRGSKVCEWTSADGKTKGEDYYYKNQTAMSGDADRMIDGETKAGEWKILGSGFWTKFNPDKKAPGKWMNLSKTGKNSYEAYDAEKKLVMTMKCG